MFGRIFFEQLINYCLQQAKQERPKESLKPRIGRANSLAEFEAKNNCYNCLSDGLCTLTWGVA